MCEHDLRCERHLPTLSDETVVEIHDFLHHVLTVFESRYSDQIHRYYDDRAQHNLIKTDQNLPLDDPSF